MLWCSQENPDFRTLNKPTEQKLQVGREAGSKEKMKAPPPRTTPPWQVFSSRPHIWMGMRGDVQTAGQGSFWSWPGRWPWKRVCEHTVCKSCVDNVRTRADWEDPSGKEKA